MNIRIVSRKYPFNSRQALEKRKLTYPKIVYLSFMSYRITKYCGINDSLNILKNNRARLFAERHDMH